MPSPADKPVSTAIWTWLFLSTGSTASLEPYGASASNDTRGRVTEFMFVMAAGAIDVDLHAFAFASGEQVASVGVAYPRAALTGRGAAVSYPVATFPS